MTKSVLYTFMLVVLITLNNFLFAQVLRSGENSDFVIPTNVIPFPSVAAECEISVANYNGNPSKIFASWMSYTQSPSFTGVGFTLTTSGGSSWTGCYNCINPGVINGNSSVWIWPNGSPWQGRLGMASIPFSAVAFYSVDNGSTWSNPVSIPTSNTFGRGFACADDIPGSPYFGRAYLLGDNFGLRNPTIIAAYSSDGGVSWTASSGNVSPAPDSSHYCFAPDVVVGPGGIVYSVWSYCNFNSPFTETAMGFAKSTDGGVSWTSQTNNAVTTNGIRTTDLYNNVRANGFPRIAIDKSGETRNGWIYVTMSEKNTPPARDNSDICLIRSTDNGITWTHTLVNNDPPGNYNWLGAISVDQSGTLAVSYYDTRNTAVPVTGYYTSISFNGGSIFVDQQVNDHPFTPAPIPGLAGNFQGDFTGLTYGNGKFWPFWADNSSGHYQVWTAGILLVTFSISGAVTYRDNGQPVTGGSVKALHYDISTGSIITYDSTGIEPNGQYTLNHVPQDTIDIMFYQNDDNLDFVPTYYISTTDWQEATKIYVNQNLTGINGQVFRIINTVNPYNITGTAFQNSAGDVNTPLGNVIVYALIGNAYKNYGITLSNGTYIANKLPFGSYTLTAQRMGYNPVSQNVTVANGNLQNINFYFGNPIGIQPVSSQIPKRFNLYQNYPNPFNPETNIKFDIPNNQRVKIIIYDIVGREVATLLNEEVKAGTYNIKWNGSDYASGVYFYRIETEPYTLTKKMLLIK